MRRYRRAWKGDPELVELGSLPLHGIVTVGDLVEEFVWSMSFRQADRLAGRLADYVDLDVPGGTEKHRKLWLVILNDRLIYGGRV